MKKCVIVLDTETAPQPNIRFANGPIASKSLCYDIGWQVREKRGGEVFERRSFVASDVFFKHDIMNSAYYAEKTPKYRRSYNDGGAWNIELASTICDVFRQDCERYNVTELWAFNCDFDKQALNTTARFIAQWPGATWAPDGCKYFDIWNAAQKITGTKAYVMWAIENGFVSEKHNPKTNVEAITAYLTNDPDFVEDHTGLSDVEHEAAILEKLMRFSHTPNPKTNGQGWRAAARMKDKLVSRGCYTPEQIEEFRLSRLANL